MMMGSFNSKPTSVL